MTVSAPPESSHGSDVARPPRIAKTALAVQSATSATEIDAYVDLGLIRGTDAEGNYDSGDITRLRLIRALAGAGIEPDKLADALATGRLSLDFAGTIVADATGLAPDTVAAARRAEAIEREDFKRLMLTLGLATPADGEAIREDDAEMMHIYAAARAAGLSTDAILSVLRAMAMGMRQIVDAQRELFRRNVEEPMLAAGHSYPAMFAASAPARIALQRLGYRMSFLLQRRLLEGAVFDNLVSRFEEALEANDVARDRNVASDTLCFVDLSDFTQATENLGDAHAASLGSALAEIAQEQSTLHRGQLVKTLGDGAMLHFSRAEDSVRAAVGILTSARDRGLPPARAGIATGPTMKQDGDYFGRTVNRAARLIGVARPDQILVTAEVAGAVASAGFRFHDLGTFQLKGIDDQIRAFSAMAV